MDTFECMRKYLEETITQHAINCCSFLHNENWVDAYGEVCSIIAISEIIAYRTYGSFDNERRNIEDSISDWANLKDKLEVLI